MKRWWIFGAIALLTIIAVFYQLRKPAERTDGGVPELLQYAPAGATSVVFIDLARFRESAFLEALQAMTPDVKQDREYTEFVAATGFDYARDLHRVVTVFVADNNAPRTVAFADARFDRQRLVNYARAHGRIEQAHGIDVLFASKEERSPGIAFLTEDRVAVAEADARATEFLARLAASKNHAGPSKELRQRIARVSAAPLFAAGRAEDLTGKLPASGGTGNAVFDQARAILKNVRWYAVAAQPEGSALRVLLEAECDNALRAGQLYTLLESARFLASAALKDRGTRRQYSAEQLALMEAVLATLSVSRDSHRVVLRFEVSVAVMK